MRPVVISFECSYLFPALMNVFCLVNGVVRMRRLKALSESRAVYADASHYHVSSAGHRETSYLCQYDSSSLPLCDHHSPAAPTAGLYRYTHICAGPPPPPSPAVVYAASGAGAGCDQQLLQPG